MSIEFYNVPRTLGEDGLRKARVQICDAHAKTVLHLRAISYIRMMLGFGRYKIENEYDIRFEYRYIPDPSQPSLYRKSPHGEIWFLKLEVNCGESIPYPIWESYYNEATSGILYHHGKLSVYAEDLYFTEIADVLREYEKKHPDGPCRLYGNELPS